MVCGAVPQSVSVGVLPEAVAGFLPAPPLQGHSLQGLTDPESQSVSRFSLSFVPLRTRGQCGQARH